MNKYNYYTPTPTGVYIKHEQHDGITTIKVLTQQEYKNE